MSGLRLGSRCFTGKTSLGIREIVDCLTPEISQLYCVAHSHFLAWNGNESEKLESDYASFLLEELDRVGVENRDLKLFRPGFLQRFRNHLYGDWNYFYLFEAKIPLSTVRPWTNELPSGCKILICCVDAAYWEVFVESPALLARLKDRFRGALTRLYHVTILPALATKGTHVTGGQQIGTIDISGCTSAPHTHIQRKVNGVLVNFTMPCDNSHYDDPSTYYDDSDGTWP